VLFAGITPEVRGSKFVPDATSKTTMSKKRIRQRAPTQVERAGARRRGTDARGRGPPVTASDYLVVHSVNSLWAELGPHRPAVERAKRLRSCILVHGTDRKSPRRIRMYSFEVATNDNPGQPGHPTHPPSTTDTWCEV
jgi:hypothetical protein